MTDKTPRLAPGCWGSSVYYRVDAPGCRACDHIASCARRVREEEPNVLIATGKLDVLFGTERQGKVQKWFAERWKEKKASENTSQKRTARALAAWSDRSINVFQLKNGSNPATKKDRLDYETFKFMLDAGPFKPRDVVEHLRETLGRGKKCVEAHVKDTCAGLIVLGILRKEGRHILCLV